MANPNPIFQTLFTFSRAVSTASRNLGDVFMRFQTAWRLMIERLAASSNV
jgi:hypothetical protein